MILIVGLGNPGPRYKLTRHNVGFMVVDALADHFQASFESSQFQAQIAKIRIGIPIDNPTENRDVLLVKPQTFMNLSGECVQAIMAFYKIKLEDLLVIHDDIDIPFTELRFHKNRGHGGQNGVKDIHEKIGPDYARIKVGVGRPSIPQMSVADHVLQNFNSDEMQKLPDVLGDACNLALDFLETGRANGT